MAHNKKKKAKIKRGRKSYNEINEMDNFYKSINEAQVSGKPVYVVFNDENMCKMAENVLKDSSVVFERKKSKKIIYKLVSKRKKEKEKELRKEDLNEEIFIFDDSEL